MRQKAFTLIELLVVIAIIGILTSIVLVNLRGSREKAKMAKNLQFSRSINHALGAYAIGIWSFDDSVADASTTDTSGYNNHCELKGGMDGSNVTEGVIIQGLEFNGGSNYLDCASSSNLDITGDLTIEAWIKLDTITSGSNNWHNIAFKGGDYNSSCNYQFAVINGWSWGGQTYNNRLAFSHYNHGWDPIPSDDDNDIAIGVWQHVVVTVVSNEVTLYKNGEVIGEGTKTRALAANNNPLIIGGREGSPSQRVDGIIDEVRIYKEALTIGQIRQHYAEGLERHKLAEK